MSPTLLADIAACDRCGAAHKDLAFSVMPSSRPDANCFAECPTTGAPILARLTLALSGDPEQAVVPRPYRKERPAESAGGP